ncbi:hypothetical protein ABZ511_09465 [Nocardia gamkensis]|uniref:hypothetical protein n=1 Tax=Nocardia gamkensis TaxID=352869 RepID=UPI00340B025B
MVYPYGGVSPQLLPPGSGRPGPPPSGATAIFAAAIALAVGLMCAVGTYSAATFALDAREYWSGEIARTIALVGGAAILYLLGAVLLILRTTVGRVLVIIDSVLGVIYVVAMVVHTGNPALLTLATPVLIALVLAALRPTGRWIAAKRTVVNRRA